MATAALQNPNARIVPLADAHMAGLEGLFDEQCDEWLALLKWDYTGPSRMIREVARHGELLGFAAVSGSLTVGFAYYILEAGRCSIGDIYVSRPWRGLGIDGQLARAVLERVDGRSRTRRVESQCVSIGNDEADAVFGEQGFTRFERHYMMVDLSQAAGAVAQATARPGRLTDSINLRAWRDEDFGQAARIIHRSYRGGYDSRINSQYATEEGCAEILGILTESLWCGDFLPQASRVAVRRATGGAVGVLLASRIAPGVGHVGQVSVHPAYQGLGVGRQMITSTLSEFRRRGFDSVSLAVTAQNANAFHLYRSCGFRTIHSFPVFYRDRRQ